MIGLLLIAGLVLVIAGFVLMGGFPVEEWDNRARWGAIIGGLGVLVLASLMLFS